MGILFDDNKVYETKDGQRFYSEGDAQRYVDYKAGRQRDEERRARAEGAAIDNYSRVKGAAEDALEDKNYPEALRLYNELVVLVEHDIDNVYSEEKDAYETYFTRATINRALGNHKAAGSDYCIAIREGKSFDDKTREDLTNYFTQQGWNFYKTYRDENKKFIVIDNFRTPWNVITRIAGFFFVASILLRLFVNNNGTFPIWGLITALIFGAFLGFIFPYILRRVGGRRSSLLNRAKFNGIKVGKFNYIIVAILLCFGYSCASGTYEKVSTGNLLRSKRSTQETVTYNIGDIVTVLDNVNVFSNSNFDDVAINAYMGSELRIIGNKVIREYNGNNFNYWQVESPNGLRGLVSARYIINSAEYASLLKGKTGSLFEPLSNLKQKLFPDPYKVVYNIGDIVIVTEDTLLYDDKPSILKVLSEGSELTIAGGTGEDGMFWSVEYEGTKGFVSAGDIKLKK